MESRSIHHAVFQGKECKKESAASAPAEHHKELKVSAGYFLSNFPQRQVLRPDHKGSISSIIPNININPRITSGCVHFKDIDQVSQSS